MHKEAGICTGITTNQMTDLHKELVQARFRNDIEALAEGLVATFGLKYSKAEKHLSWAADAVEQREAVLTGVAGGK